jgi:hypothetical protein
MDWETKMQEAYEIGKKMGEDAATWLEFESWKDAYAVQHKETLYEYMPGSPLSGIWADSYSTTDLLSDLDLDIEPDETPELEEVYQYFDDGWSIGWTDEAERRIAKMLPKYPKGNGPDLDKAVMVQGYKGIACRIVADYGETVEFVMVGDDRRIEAESSEITEISEDSFCCVCGQIGCSKSL